MRAMEEHTWFRFPNVTQRRLTGSLIHTVDSASFDRKSSSHTTDSASFDRKSYHHTRLSWTQRRLIGSPLHTPQTQRHLTGSLTITPDSASFDRKSYPHSRLSSPFVGLAPSGSNRLKIVKLRKIVEHCSLKKKKKREESQTLSLLKQTPPDKSLLDFVGHIFEKKKLIKELKRQDGGSKTPRHFQERFSSREMARHTDCFKKDNSHQEGQGILVTSL
ncbi:hypothetical protein GQ457_14G012130 [Hibiscus cannabinus]